MGDGTAAAPPTVARPGDIDFGVTAQWRAGVRPRPRVLKMNLVALAIIAFWAGAMWVAPYTLDEGSVELSPDGAVGRIDNLNATDEMNWYARWIYHTGDKQCHQLPQRTLVVNDNPMPFCARDVGIYTLLAIGVGLTVFPRMPWYDRITELRWWLVVLALIPIGVDGVGQLLGYWESTNPIRLITGGLIGVVTGMALGYMLREVGPVLHDGWRDWRSGRRWDKHHRSGPPPPPQERPPATPPPPG